MLNLLRAGAGEIVIEYLGDGLANDFAHHSLRPAHLALVLELNLSGDAGERAVEIAGARHGQRFAMQNGAALCIGDDQFQGADGQTLTDPAAAIDFFIFARGEGDLFDDGADVAGNLGLHQAAFGPGFLAGDGDAFYQGQADSGCEFPSRCDLSTA